MRLVIADTGPVNYLILIEHIEVLSQLFDRVILPYVVQRELLDGNAPPEVRSWIANPPAWLEVHEVADMEPLLRAGLELG